MNAKTPSGQKHLRPAYELVYALLGADAQLHDAFDLADHTHAGQTRQTPSGRTPYLLHPLRVFFRLVSWGVADSVILVAALLHDVVEDAPDRVVAYLGHRMRTSDSRAEALLAISDRFGPSVASVVEGLSNKPGVGYVEHVSAVVADARVLAVKCSDFFDNALSLDPAHPRYAKLQAKYAPVYPVLADRLACSAEAQRLVPAWESVLRALS